MEVKAFHQWPEDVKTKEEIEKAAEFELWSHVMSCETASSRFGEDGFYVKVGDKVYLFKVDISFVREVTGTESIPTGLN